MPVWLQWAAEALPLTPACGAVSQLVLRGGAGAGLLLQATLLPAAWIAGTVTVLPYYHYCKYSAQFFFVRNTEQTTCCQAFCS